MICILFVISKSSRVQIMCNVLVMASLQSEVPHLLSVRHPDSDTGRQVGNYILYSGEFRSANTIPPVCDLTGPTMMSKEARAMFLNGGGEAALQTWKVGGP